MVFNTFKDSLAKYVFLKQTGTVMPASYYLGFSTTTPAEDASNITEPSSSSGYKKVALSLSSPTKGVVTNTNPIEYGEALSNWGTITYTVIFDENGVPLFCDPLKQPFSVDKGDLVRVKTGNVKLYVGDVGVA